MSRSLLVAVPLCCTSLLAPAIAAADDLATALKTGKTNLSFRLRHEQVQDDAFDKDANAATLRTRVSYTSGKWNNLDLLVEFDHVGHLIDDRFNDTRNGNVQYPNVPDPKGADLNQAALRYSLDGLTVTAGRQRINYDNQRFIGGAAWRNNEQTFDALRLTYLPLQNVTLDYAWVSDTRRVFGPDNGNPPGALVSDHHLVNAKWSASKALTLGGYFYALDFDDTAAMSSKTAGAYLSGEASFDRIGLDYRVEAARQSDYADNPVSYDADYHLLSLGVKVAGIRIGVAQERLAADEDAGVAFATPLATAHAFQGWADKFLNTPAGGIDDTYISVGGTVQGVNLMAVWHQYDSEATSAELGTELNLLASKKFGEHYTLTLKYADYQADDFSTDAQKIWLMAEAAF